MPFLCLLSPLKTGFTKVTVVVKMGSRSVLLQMSMLTDDNIIDDQVWCDDDLPSEQNMYILIQITRFREVTKSLSGTYLKLR